MATSGFVTRPMQPFTGPPDGTENRAILEAAQKFSGIEFLESNGARIFSVPEGRKLVSAKPFEDEHLAAPERRRGTATAASLAGFCKLVNRFKDEDSAVFADIANKSSPKLIGVLDYNPASPNNEDARFGQHRVTYAFPLSQAWQAWSRPQEGMAQAKFAEFLEDRILDVMDPAMAGEKAVSIAGTLGVTLASPSRLLELSRGLKVRAETKVGAVVNLSTGETQIAYEEAHKGDDSGPLKVPGAFVVAVPVFEGGDVFQLPVRLRYRVQSGAVAWSLLPIDTQTVFDAAVNDAIKAVETETALPVYAGTPET